MTEDRTIVVVVDSRLWLPPKIPRDFGKDLRAAFTYGNPDFYKKQALGFATWGVPRQTKTHETRTDELGKRLTLPRGGIGKLRKIAAEHGIRLRFADRTTACPAVFPEFQVDPGDADKVLRWYQDEAVAAALERRQGVIRAPTGSGKTMAALAFIEAAGERALVVMRDGNLLEQWEAVARKCLGLTSDDMAFIRGGKKYKPGRRLTLALQQSLWKRSDRLGELFAEDPFGAVVVDEVQTVAARTFHEVVDKFPTKYRIGFSADETRKDKKEFLIYDAMGPVIYEIDRARLEGQGVIHPVTVRVVPTEFRADWYRDAEPGERDFQRLVEEMSHDEHRNQVILDTIREAVDSGETPAMVFLHRREHARDVSETWLPEAGIGCGLLLGGDGDDRIRFREDRARLESGKVPVAAGTFQSMGVGIDMPVVQAGIVGTPISSSNRQFFGQVRGRICRPSEGKDSAFLYYLWDRHVFPRQLRHLMAWNDRRVEIQERGQWVQARG